jgi:hypothetical protein
MNMYRLAVLSIVSLIIISLANAQEKLPIDWPIYSFDEKDFIHQNINGHDLKSQFFYVGRVFKLNTGEKTAPIIYVTGYRGAAFPIPKEVEVVNNMEMEKNTEIAIKSIENGMFITKNGKTDAVPFIRTNGELDTQPIMFINVIWIFAEKMEFSTEKARYEVTRAGATISFTKSGVKLDGVIKIDLPSQN